MAVEIRKSYITFEEKRKKYLPKVSNELIASIIDAEESGFTSGTLNTSITYNVRNGVGILKTDYKQKKEELSKLGIRICAITGDMPLVAEIPFKLETLFELSKDSDIIDIQKHRGW